MRMKNLLTLLKDRSVLWLPALNQPQCEIAAPQNANHFALLAALPSAPGRALAKRLCSLMFWRWLYSYVIAVTPWAAWPLTAILEYLLLACLWQGISSAVSVFAGMYGMEVVFKALPMAVIILMVLSCFIISLCVSTIACAALTLPVLNLAWLRNPQLITTSDEGLSLDWLRSGHKGPIRLAISWSEIVRVNIADISYQGHNAMPVLEVRLASARGKPWQFYSWAVRMSQLFSDPATGWCLEDRGTECIRIPLALLGTEHERKSLIASISQQLTPDRLDASVTAQFQTNDFDSFTALWLADLHSAPSRYSKRTLPVGHLLKRAEYLIESIFGYGGFSVVYQAVRNHLAQNATQDTTLDERVAVKELMLNSRGGASAREAECKHIISEVGLLKQLDHPGIVKCLDFFLEAGRAYIVLEAINGVNLRDFVRQHAPLPEHDVIEISLACCDILNYLHSRIPAIVHRDLSPDNFIMREDNRVKLVDFNVSSVSEQTAAEIVVGKHCFMAPEQFRGISTQQSDLYQLGATMYFFATAQDPEPLTQSNPGAVRSGLTGQFCRIVQKLTAMNPGDRYANIAEIVHDLEALQLAKAQSLSTATSPDIDQGCNI
jgi:serine/threonine protein kinase